MIELPVYGVFLLGLVLGGLIGGLALWLSGTPAFPGGACAGVSALESQVAVLQEQGAARASRVIRRSAMVAPRYE